MRILVSGGAGFIGSHVVELLARKHHDIMVMDDLSTGQMEWINPALIQSKRVNFDLCRVQTWDHVDTLIKGFQPDIICHLAAQPAISTSWENPILNAEINEIGTLNIIESAKAHGVNRIVFTSTSAVYKETLQATPEFAPTLPNTPYGISKLAGEQYVRSMFKDSVILRLGNVFGPRQVPIGENQVIPRMLRHFLYGDEFAIHGDGEQKRDFVYVEDVADAFALSLWGTPGTYNIATGFRVSVNALGKMIGKMYGVEEYKWDHTARQDPRRDIHLDVSAAYKSLAWKADRNLERGIELTCKWWNDRKANDQRPHIS